MEQPAGEDHAHSGGHVNDGSRAQPGTGTTSTTPELNKALAHDLHRAAGKLAEQSVKAEYLADRTEINLTTSLETLETARQIHCELLATLADGVERFGHRAIQRAVRLGWIGSRGSKAEILDELSDNAYRGREVHMGVDYDPSSRFPTRISDVGRCRVSGLLGQSDVAHSA